MAKKSKFAFNFKEFASLAERIENAGGDLQKAADSALRATHGMITPRLKQNIARHEQTGETKSSLGTAARVVWENPLKAHVDIGFALDNGGLPSIFLMWGTPKMRPDAALHDAAFGPKIKSEVAKVQRKALETVLKRLEG